MQALEVRNLVKQYRNGVQALKGIDLNVAQGDFFALLGPNGAGKSTLIGICTSLVNKTSGSLRVFGHDLDTELEAAKAEHEARIKAYVDELDAWIDARDRNRDRAGKL